MVISKFYAFYTKYSMRHEKIYIYISDKIKITKRLRLEF